jgi:hypothetical protein
METPPTVPDRRWFCPLLGRMIEEGRCLDINYQRLGYFKPDVLDEVRRETRKCVDEVSAVCEQCSHQPL